MKTSSGAAQWGVGRSIHRISSVQSVAQRTPLGGGRLPNSFYNSARLDIHIGTGRNGGLLLNDAFRAADGRNEPLELVLQLANLLGRGLS